MLKLEDLKDKKILITYRKGRTEKSEIIIFGINKFAADVYFLLWTGKNKNIHYDKKWLIEELNKCNKTYQGEEDKHILGNFARICFWELLRKRDGSLDNCDYIIKTYLIGEDL